MHDNSAFPDITTQLVFPQDLLGGTQRRVLSKECSEFCIWLFFTKWSPCLIYINILKPLWIHAYIARKYLCDSLTILDHGKIVFLFSLHRSQEYLGSPKPYQPRRLNIWSTWFMSGTVQGSAFPAYTRLTLDAKALDVCFRHTITFPHESFYCIHYFCFHALWRLLTFYIISEVHHLLNLQTEKPKWVLAGN